MVGLLRKYCARWPINFQFGVTSLHIRSGLNVPFSFHLPYRLYDQLSPYFTVSPPWKSLDGEPETVPLPECRKMPWDQDDKDWVEPELTREEILGHIKFCKSRQEVADYARCIAESHDDESLYYLILGTFEMMEESGCEEKFQDTIQKHKELLLSKIF